MTYTNCLHLIIIALAIAVYYLYSEKHGLIVYWFHRPGCGHCDKMEPEWAKAEKLMAGSSATLKRIDTSKPANKELANNFEIDGVPQVIKISPNGARVKYDGDRTADDMVTWISKN